MPSPTIATTLPSACSCLDLVRLLVGQHLGQDVRRCQLRGRSPRRWRGCRRSASTRRARAPCSCSTAACDSGRSVSATRDQPSGLLVDSDEHRRRARRVRAPRRARPARRARCRSPPAAPGCRAGPRGRRRAPGCPWPANAWKCSAFGSSSPSSLRARRRWPRPAGAPSRPRPRPPAASRSCSDSAVGGDRRCVTAGLPRVSVPVLSSTMVLIAARALERLAAADQDAVLGGLARADHDRGRRGQAERARAGDDQHRDRRLQRQRQARLGARTSTIQPTKVSAASDQDGRARTPRRCGRPGAASAPWSPAPPRPGARSARAWCPCRPSWPGRRSCRVLLRVAPMTWSPGPFSTGRLSPVSMLSSSAERPSSMTPSTGTFSPGARAPGRRPCTLSIGMSCSTPLRITRAVRGLQAHQRLDRARWSASWRAPRASGRAESGR